MPVALFDGTSQKLFKLRAACRVCSLSLIFAVITVATASAETKNVRIMMDWIIQGTHAPFFVAQDKGYFKEQGVRWMQSTPERVPPMSRSLSRAVCINSAGSTCPR